MLQTLKIPLSLLLVLICVLLPACFEAPANEDTNSSTPTTATKSATIVIVGTELQSAEIDSDETSYTFPSTDIEYTSKVIFTLTNTGDVPAKITSAPQMESPFSYSSGSFPGKGGTCSKIIKPTENCTIAVDFSPTAMGKVQSVFKLIYNNGKVSRTFEKTFFGKGESIPRITAVSPAFGSVAGGNTMTITGSQIFLGATVKLGGETCIGITSVLNQITCTVPVHALGTVDVEVTNFDGKTNTFSSGYRYVPSPTVTSVSPSAGALAGSTSLTITGTGFLTGATASVGGVACTTPVINSSTSLSCLTGAHTSGVTSIIVTNTDTQSGTGSNLYTYQQAPTVTSVLPSAGSINGSTSITITGSGFLTGATVTVGGTTCTSPTVNSPTSISCTTGSHSAGATDIIVTNADTQTGTGSGLYTYQPAPTVTAIGPHRIYINGRSVTVTGANFVSGVTVSINGSACSSPALTGSTSIACTVGANTVGTYSVIVTNADNQSGTLTNGLTVADNDVWLPMTTIGAPSGKGGHVSVWTGSKLFVWAGQPWNESGGLYDPITDSWTTVMSVNNPGGRDGTNVGVWTGSKVLVWGGYSTLQAGGQYDPISNSWTTITTTGAPTGRHDHSMVWTGKNLVVWGGGTHTLDTSLSVNTGGLYDPSSNSWTTMDTTGAPSERSRAVTLWTGGKFFVFGGYKAPSSFNTGGLYDPYTNAWTETTTTGAPDICRTGVWAGSKALIWGGYLNRNALYDPANNSWTSVTTVGAQLSRYDLGIAWNGSKMLIWGGSSSANYLNTGGLFDPTTNSWASMTTIGAPENVYGRGGVSIEWTGGRMLVWGGTHITGPYAAENTGGQFIPPIDPASNTWTTMSTIGAPSNRTSAGIWTGSKMIVWGGSDGGYLNSGGQYDPVVNSWSILSTTDAPSQRSAPAVWTGAKMIIWGGGDGVTSFNTGGQYDPVANTWSITSTTGIAVGNGCQGTLWTGNKMIAWSNNSAARGGSLYDPATNLWSNMTTTNAPQLRSSHVMAWTGSKMLVFGGYNIAADAINTGGVYDPASNTWENMASTGVPLKRAAPVGVWNGSKFLVWGGTDAISTRHNTGGIYDPASNTWTTMSTTSAPIGSQRATAVWTGSEMIVWGGIDNGGGYTGKGGRYNFETNSWMPTGTISSPSNRADMVSVWTGGKMLIWGGYPYTNSGAIYTP